MDPEQPVIPCAARSRLRDEIHNEGAQEHLSMALSPMEMEALATERKRKIVRTDHTFRQEENKTFEKHFEESDDLPDRKEAILTAIEDGYRQSEIARYLNISPLMVSKVFRSK